MESNRITSDHYVALCAGVAQIQRRTVLTPTDSTGTVSGDGQVRGAELTVDGALPHAETFPRRS